MLNKASAHLLTLGNNIYTRMKFLTNIYLFIVSNRDTRSEICPKLKIKAPRFYTYFTPFSSVSTGTYFTTFSSVSTADFD